MALQPRTRRDTPAQDSTFQRREQTFRRDVSALQEAGLQAQDRDNENNAVANVVRNTTSTMPDNFGNSGSPTLRRVGQSALAGARAGAQRAQQWRTDTLRGDTAGGSGFPTTAETMGRIRAGSPPAMRGAGPQTTEASRTPDTQTGGAGTLRSALGAVGEFFRGARGTAEGSGFTAQQMAESEANWEPRLNLRSPGDIMRANASQEDPYGVRNGTTTTGMPAALQPGARTGNAGRPNPQIDPTALGMARGVGGGQGYAIGPDGRTQFFEGTQRSSGPSNLSVMGNMGAAADEFARANAIRQEYIDSQRPQNQVTVLSGETPLDAALQRDRASGAQMERLMRSAQNARSGFERAGINRMISQMQNQQEISQAGDEGALDRQNQLALQQMRNQGALASTLANQQGTDPVNPYDAARALQIQQEMSEEERTQFPAYDPDEIEAILSMPEGMREVAMQQYAQRMDQQFAGAQLDSILESQGASRQDALESYQAGELDPNSELGMLVQQVYGGMQPTNDQTEDFAGGGLVPEFSALGFAQGGMVPDQYGSQMGPGMDMGSAVGMGAPGHQGIDLMQMEYDQYAQGAQQLGVPAVPFEEFVGLKQQSIPQAPSAPGASQPMTGALQSAVRMAQGGMVPGQDPSDTSGKMIVDPDPDAPQDSIPAVIDGTRPAKLDSGEFVIPRDVVMFYGTDKLNKMIEQAKEKGQGNGTQPGSASAVQQSASAAGR